jgi:DNA modification methylase
VLAELLGRVETSSAAVRDLLSGLARSAGLPVERGRTDPDEVPEPATEPRVRPGEVWVLGEHRIACADAQEPASYASVLGEGVADAVWTDPPYGVGYVGKTREALRIRSDRGTDTDGLLAASFSALDPYLAAGAPIYVCHPSGPGLAPFFLRFIETGWSLRQTLVWVKDAMVLGRSDYHYRHEWIVYGRKPGGGRRGRGFEGWYGGNARDSIFEIARPKASREHPTMKPVELVARCLEDTTAPGALALDPFLGSGSTLIAAERTGRRCVGLELDPVYADVAISRWERYTGRQAHREQP